MGSAMAPDIEGPRTNPEPNADVTMAMPRAWLLSSDDSDSTAFIVPTIPIRAKEMGWSLNYAVINTSHTE